MTVSSTTFPGRVVVLIAANGAILTHFTTDRDEFPTIATHDRDRIFELIFTGDLAALHDMNLPTGIVIQGAVYKEVAVWRISHRTIDKPRTTKRRRKTAKVLPFRRRAIANG